MFENNALSLAPLTNIRENLNRLFGKDAWLNWELETISLELRIVFDDLTRDKISLLQTVGKDPTLFFNDAIFFLHATDVINNKTANFEYLPMPSSLELAYSIKEGIALGLPTEVLKDPNSDIVDVIAYLLIDEGYSEPVLPFDFIPISKFTSGQTRIDIEAKKKAIELYIEGMNRL